MNAAKDPKPTRRRFLVLGGVAGLALLGLGAFFSRGNVGSWVQRLTRAHLSPQRKLLAFFPYLKIPEEVADQYVADYRLRIRDVGRLSQLGEDFYKRFLLSSDFFQNGADESRTLGYVAIYGPTITACYNPLAKLD